MTEKFYIKSENGENKDLEVYESRRLIGPDSYDDDWKLQRYTSELRNERDDSFYAYIDFKGNEGTIRECPHCEEYGFHYKLGPKIKKKDEIAPDDEKFLSCYECGNTFGIHETFQEAKIKDSLETVSSPFENEPVFLSTDSRKEQRRKGKKPKTRFSRKFNNPDPDIQREIDSNGADNVRIIK